MRTANITKQIPDILGLGGGAVAASYLTSKLPIGNEKIKQAAPILVGLFLSPKKGIMGSVGKGMIAAGAANLARSFGIGDPDTVMIGDPFVRSGNYVNGPTPATGGDPGTSFGEEMTF